VAAPIEPPELAALVDLAERPRATGWSLRAALVRYAQPEPVRSGAILELVRRVDGALKGHAKALAKQGPAIWDAVEGGGATPDVAQPLVDLLVAIRGLDELGDRLAAWAVDPAQDRPDAAVDEVVATTGARLDELGVVRERRQGQRARPGGGPRRRPPAGP
jgi:hypothetical protein